MSEALNIIVTSVIPPTPEQIDELAAKRELALAAASESDIVLGTIETELIALVQMFGTVPAHAENSRELAGRYWELMVTIGNTVNIDPARVQDVKEALEANGFGQVFANLFAPRIRYELVKDADKAILAAGMNKRLTEKVQALFGRCFEAKKKSPALKVKKIVEKPAKKSRAKKEAING
jgi:hypothetical protein